MKPPNISVLFDEYENVQDFLIRGLNITKSQLKKEKLKKSFLEKEVSKGESLNIPINLLNRGMIGAVYEGEKIEILYEDENFLVLEKPHKIHCHPLNYLEGDNCLSLLREQNKTVVLEVNKSNYDRGLVYRLDYETSGVLVLVKSDDLYDHIRANFKDVAKEKSYYALVSGSCHMNGSCKTRLKPSGPNKEKIIVSDDGELVELSIEPLRERNGYTLLRIQLKTGYRHQIRAQLADLGFPIVGDKLYGGEEANRLCLHAESYSFFIENKMHIFKSKRDENLFFDLLNVDC